jgi:Beta-L-arabinofuranosidase, GH127
LAYTLGDERLTGKARIWVEAIAKSQRSDGFFGPATNGDWWPRMVALKALIQFYEATGDERVLDFLARYFKKQQQELPNRPLSDWGKARGADNVLAVCWLADRRPGIDRQELGELLLHQTIDWGQYLTRELITGAATRFNHRTHVVNVAMGLRYLVAQAELGDPVEAKILSEQVLNNLDRRHGMVTGMFSGDEWLAGTAPEQGVELCAVVEFLYSLDQGFRRFGQTQLLDRLEQVAYNVLAAHLSADCRAHQYHQQVNQIACSIDRRNWTYSSDDANTFGLELRSVAL